jgi:hypothetical protein
MCRKSGGTESDDGWDGSGLEEESGESRLAESRQGLKKELAAALNKIFELREIIRSLELQMETKERIYKVVNRDVATGTLLLCFVYLSLDMKYSLLKEGTYKSIIYRYTLSLCIILYRNFSIFSARFP